MNVQEIADWWDTIDADERRHVKFKANVGAHSSTPWAALDDLDKTRLMMHVEATEGKPARIVKHSGDLYGQLTAAVARHEGRQQR
jgi:hypothetical protein